MSLTALVSYDDTPSDHDALMLARILGSAGARPLLVYVRHTRPRTRAPVRSLRSMRPARCSSAAPAGSAGGRCPRRLGIVLSASTAEGLRRMAEGGVLRSHHLRLRAPHRARPHRAAALDADSSSTAARRPWRSRRPVTAQTGTLHHDDRGAGPRRRRAAIATARRLAERLNADLVDHGRGLDLLVIGSQEEAPVGQVMVSARARNEIESATAPVLVIARGVPLRFAVRAPPEFSPNAPNPTRLSSAACARCSSPICTSARGWSTTCCADPRARAPARRA